MPLTMIPTLHKAKPCEKKAAERMAVMKKVATQLEISEGNKAMKMTEGLLVK